MPKAKAMSKRKKKSKELTDDQLKIEIAKRIPLKDLAATFVKSQEGGSGS